MSTSSDKAFDPARANGMRQLWLRALIAVVLIGALASVARYYLEARWYAATDNAYVGGNIVQITPQIAGTVIQIAADDGDLVEAGQTLVQLDTGDLEVAQQQAEANLAGAVRKARGLYNSAASADATLSTQRVQLQRARDDYRRREHLTATGAISQEELQHARNALSAAEKAVAVAREDLTRSQALIEDSAVESLPEVKSAVAALHKAYLDRARTALIAPVTGYVAMRSVQLGSRVQPGTPLLAVVPLEQLWVDANFKENQLRHVRIGQPVTLKADFYGDAVVYRGHVESLGVGTGAAFSLLPAENATGNWIKIVQRLPVRIALEPEALRAHPLRVGLSMKADIDLHNRSGSALVEQPRAQPLLSTEVYTGRLEEASRLAQQIIRDNLPRERATPAAQTAG